MTVILQTERLTLRKPCADDWPAARDFFTSDRAAFIGGQVSEGKAWRKLAMEIGHWDMRGFGMFIATRKDSNDALALVGPWFPVDWPEKEIGWMVLDPAAEGKGIATEAVQEVLRYVFGSLHWKTAVSYIAPGNKRSIALAEKLGAVRDDAAPTIPGADPHFVYRHPTQGAV